MTSAATLSFKSCSMTVTEGNQDTITKVTPTSASRRRGKHARRKFLRSLVEQELESRRRQRTDESSSAMEGVTLEETTHRWKDISEEDLLQFLYELERDDASDDELVDEMERSLALETEYYSDRLIHDEQWTDALVVVCPMCHDGNLSTNDAETIVCSNAMDGSCSFRLYSQLSLDALSERLRLVFEEHGSICRELPRVFQMHDENLCAVCPSCGIHRTIVGA